MFTVDKISDTGNLIGECQKFANLEDARDEYDYIVDTDQLEAGETIQLWDKTGGDYVKLDEYESIDEQYQIACIKDNFSNCEKGIYDISFQKAIRNVWVQKTSSHQTLEYKEIELIYAYWNGVDVELTQVGENSQNFPLTELTAKSLKDLADKTIGIENNKIDYA